MGYSKLWSDIARSSLLEYELHVRWVFVMMVALKDSNGIVFGTRAALARAVNLSLEQTSNALDLLCAPDPDSTSKRDEGRRLREITPNRWLVVNADDYRGRRDDTDPLEKGRARVARHRARKEAALAAKEATADVQDVTPVTGALHVTLCNGDENEDENEDENAKRHLPSGAPPDELHETLDLYNETCGHVLTKAQKLTPGRRKAIKARLEEHGREGLAHIFAKAVASAFLTGANDRGWRADFDWLLKAENAVKVLEGRYDPPTPRGSEASLGRDLTVLDDDTRDAMAASMCPKCKGPNPWKVSECRDCYMRAHPGADPATLADIFPVVAGVPS
jgi:hypothetical protein